MKSFIDKDMDDSNFFVEAGKASWMIIYLITGQRNQENMYSNVVIYNCSPNGYIAPTKFCHDFIPGRYVISEHTRNRKTMNRNWSNQKPNPALKNNMGNKKIQIDKKQ